MQRRLYLAYSNSYFEYLLIKAIIVILESIHQNWQFDYTFYNLTEKSGLANI